VESRRLGCLLAALSFLVPLLVYSLTLCRTVSFVDAGELCVASSTLGVPHPTGYPLYVLLGRIFSILLPGPPIIRTNFLSAFFAAGSGLFLYLAVVRLLSGIEKDERKVMILAFFSAGAFSFSLTIWTQAVVTEVYSLTAFFASVLLYLSFSDDPRAPALFAYSLGLSLTNHMSIVMVGLPCGVYLIATRRIALKTLPLLALFFLVGLSAYAYLPLRAGQSPVINWGNPGTLERFIWHVTGKQYRVWMFSSDPATLKRHLVQFTKLLLGQYSPFLIWLPLLGFAVSAKRVAVWVLAAVFVLDVLYSANYDIPDIDAYYIPAFLVSALGIALGLQFLSRKTVRKRVLLLGVGVMAIPLALNCRKCDMSRNRIAYEYGENYLRSIETGGLCLTNNWDIYSPIFYIRYGEGKRRDVVMIDKELLRRSWYFDYLRNEYPATCRDSEHEIESYLEELENFEHGTLAGPEEIQRRYIAMVNSLVENHMRTGRAYTTFTNGHDIDAPDIGRQLHKIPHGLVYEFSGDAQVGPFDWSALELGSSFGARIYRDERTESNLSRYPLMMLLSGVALSNSGMYEDARIALLDALTLEPENEYARLHLGGVELMLGHYEQAVLAFEEVLRSDPDNEFALQGIREARSKLGLK
jgi:tetratricopeptide (TPR) repeat protein